MAHALKYIHGLVISIAALPFVLICGVLFFVAFLAIYGAYMFAIITTFIYECPLAPKAERGERLKNPIAKFSEMIVNFPLSRV